MPKLVNREILLAGIEGTYNTDPTLTGSDAMYVEGMSWQHAGAMMVERPLVRTSKGKLRHLFAGTLIEVSFAKEVKGSGAPGTAPEIGTLLRGAGMGETVVASTSVTYKPVSTAEESLTFYLYEDGVRTIITGARASACSFSMESGGRIMANFTFVGHVAVPADVALVTPTYESTVPPIFVSAGVDLDSYGPVIESLSCDLGLSTIMPKDANASDGYGEITITGRDVTVGMNPESVLVATRAFVSDYRTNQVDALQTGQIGSAGNQVQFSWPAVTAREIGPGDREGIRTYEVTFGAAESSGDDEVSIIFT